VIKGLDLKSRKKRKNIITEEEEILTAEAEAQTGPILAQIQPKIHQTSGKRRDCVKTESERRRFSSFFR
jgi:hypothetical protein